MNRKKILENLKNDTYCRLKPSTINGVGVFAIRSIPKGINPFKCGRMERVHGFKEEELKNLHPEVLRMIDDYFVFRKGKFWISNFGSNGIDFSFFVNSSKKPNLKSVRVGNDFILVTIRDIKVGEELTADFSTYDEHSKNDDSFKFCFFERRLPLKKAK